MKEEIQSNVEDVPFGKDWQKEMMNFSKPDLIELLKNELKSKKENKILAFDDEVKWILGRPNFVVSPLAHLLRKSGQEINTRAEDEQAEGIYWMLCLYDEYGLTWREEMKKEINRMKHLLISDDK